MHIPELNYIFNLHSVEKVHTFAFEILKHQADDNIYSEIHSYLLGQHFLTSVFEGKILLETRQIPH